jgi:cytochrome c-type biogenesis protein
LLLVYALGLGVPFLLVGLLIDRAGPIVRRVSRYVGPISVAGGAILALTGVLILSGRLAQLATYAPLISY